MQVYGTFLYDSTNTIFVVINEEFNWKIHSYRAERLGDI